MLKQRVITAVVLLALLVGALAWSVVAFELLATAVLGTNVRGVCRFVERATSTPFRYATKPSSWLITN